MAVGHHGAQDLADAEAVYASKGRGSGGEVGVRGVSPASTPPLQIDQ